MNAALTILFDERDLAALDAPGGDALRGDLLAFTPDIHLRLLERGIAHLTPWDVVGRDEHAALVEFERDVQRFWGAQARADYRGLNLLALAAYRHVSCFARLAWAAHVVNRALDERRPGRVCPFAYAGGHGLDQPAENRAMPLLFGLLRAAAERRGIECTPIAPSAPPHFHDAVALRSATRRPPIDFGAELGRRPYVLFCASGADLLRQLPLVEELCARDTAAAIQLYKHADAATLAALAQYGHAVWHESQVAYGVDLPNNAGAARAARAAFERAAERLDGPAADIFASPHTRSHFDFVFGEYLRRMAWHVDAWRRLFERCPPRLLVTNYPAPVVDVAHACGVPTLVLTHGLMFAGDTRFFLSLPAVTLGAVSAPHGERLRAAGASPEHVRVTGDLGADRLLRAAANPAQPEQAAARLRARLGIEPGRRLILLATSDLGSPSVVTRLPLLDFADAVRCVEEFAAWAVARSDCVFLHRGHPRFDHPQLYERVNRSLPAERRLRTVTDVPLDELMPAVDAAVVMNVMSSALIEFSLWGKPVIHLVRSLIWFDPREWLVEAWPRAATIPELTQMLDELVRDPQQAVRLARQTRAAVEAFFGGPPEPAAPRCARLIEQLGGVGPPPRPRAALESGVRGARCGAGRPHSPSASSVE